MSVPSDPLAHPSSGGPAPTAAEAAVAGLPQAFDPAPVPVLIVDRDGVVRWVNEAGSQALAPPVVGEPLASLLSPAVSAGAPARGRVTVRGAGGPFEAKVTGWDVGGLGVRLLHPVAGPAGIDELGLRLILDDLAEGVAVAGADGRFVLFNTRAEEILGIGGVDGGPDAWSARYGCFLPDGVTPYPPDRLPLARALAGEAVDDAEVLVRNDRRPDGVRVLARARPIRDAGGRLLGGVVAFSDVTERRRSAEALAANESRKAAVLTSIAEGLAITDESGLVLSVNPALEDMTGWAASELTGRPVHEAVRIVDATGRPMAAPDHFLCVALRLGQVVTSHGFAHTLARRDGSRVAVAVTAAPITATTGAPVGGVLTVRDVSRERDVDELKTTLLSHVSHELRTPLAIIVGWSEILLTRTVDDAKRREALERINASGRRLARLIDDLLSVSRIESGRVVIRPRPLDLRSVVAEVVDPPPGRDIVVDVPEALPPVLADHDMLVQILTNLVDNAVKYSDETVTVSAGREGDAVRISVRDRGVGLSESDLARVWQRFFRSDRPEVRSREGTGLGLFITRHLVEMLGGEIRLESELDRGTTVIVDLPVAGPPGGVP